MRTRVKRTRSRFVGRFFGFSLLAAGLLLSPAPTVVEVPAEGRTPCLSLGFEGSVTRAGDPLNQDDPVGTLDSGSLACNGKPRNC